MPIFQVHTKVCTEWTKLDVPVHTKACTVWTKLDVLVHTKARNSMDKARCASTY